MKGVGKSKKKKEPVKAEDLVDQGNAALSKMQPELALKFYSRALSLAPENTNIMDALADVHIQLGEPEHALPLLQQSTTLAPTENVFKWLFLSQLQQGLDALTCYQQGIQLMLASMAGEQDEDSKRVFKKQITKAHCSIAELYLTDLCFEDGAEVACEAAIMEALAIDPHSLDGQQTLASLRISQTRMSEACGIISGVYAVLKSIREKLRARTVFDEIRGEGMDDPELSDIPEPDFCISTIKLLVECGAVQPTLLECAMELITDMLHDDDDNIELWYIMGVAALSISPPELDIARYHLERAQEMMEALLEQTSQDDFPYHDQYRLLQEHMSLLEKHEGAAGVTPTPVPLTTSAKMADEDEEWTSCSDDDDTDK